MFWIIATIVLSLILLFNFREPIFSFFLWFLMPPVLNILLSGFGRISVIVLLVGIFTLSCYFHNTIGMIASVGIVAFLGLTWVAAGWALGGGR